MSVRRHGRGSATATAARRKRTRLIQLVVVALVAATLLGVGQQQDASAAMAADFQAGNIISDSVFFDSAALTADQVQAFLVAKGGSCVAGTAACLKDYVTTTVAKPADAFCRGYQGGLAQSAAQIIAGVAGSCGVSPKVLLVLLEKEQSLVTGTQPSLGNYRAATGYGCPDTAACDTQYYGYFNQVYSAARQYQVYATNPQDYRYQARQNNTIYFNPDAGCGSSTVYIANQATAGLYNYTPYQPNAAAMNNLYGNGDTCSAYGNRNFWRLFSDWFGNPQTGSFLLRTPENPAVYLVSGTMKYPVLDMDTVRAMSPLGSVGFVSQQYLDRRTTGAPMSRVVLAPSGGVYFLDAGIRLPFGSCAQVADYGASCDSLIRLDQTQIDAFVSGPPMTSLYRTTSGKAFYVSGGAKREVVDDAALTAAGFSTSGVRLLESGLAYLPYGVPVTRDGVVLRDRRTGASVVAAGGGFTQVPDGVRAATVLASWPVRELDDASVARLSVAVAPGPLVASAGGAQVFLLTGSGKRLVTDASMAPASVPVVSDALLAVFPDEGSLAAGTFVKGSAGSAVYALRAGQRRTVLSWADLVALAGGGTPQILSIDQRLVDLLPAGPAQLGPGSLVYSPRSAAVYFVNNAGELVPLPAFSVSNELGATRLARVADADIDAYTVRAGGLSTAVDCGSAQYLGLGGRLYQVGADVADAYRLGYTTLDPLACAALPKGGALTRFLRAGSGAIYYIDAGTKRPIRGYGGYLALGGTPDNTIQVSDFALSLIPTGAPW